MAFVKTESYFRNKIENIKKAIIGTEKDLAKYEVANNRGCREAHESYLESCKKDLAKARAEFEKWSNEN
jgi:hypothetical protein